tara:strand:- start:31111 stop:31419 length:309 start_codon:yes stop_codon:yes gene_type:complete
MDEKAKLNANSPAMPNDIDSQSFGIISGSSSVKEHYQYRAGLTKLEDLAGKLFVAEISCAIGGRSYQPRSLANNAISNARSFFEELEKWESVLLEETKELDK